jgi:hypothetical protein
VGQEATGFEQRQGEQASYAKRHVQVGGDARQQDGDHQHMDEQKDDCRAGDPAGKVEEARHAEPVKPYLQHNQPAETR